MEPHVSSEKREDAGEVAATYACNSEDADCSCDSTSFCLGPAATADRPAAPPVCTCECNSCCRFDGRVPFSASSCSCPCGPGGFPTTAPCRRGAGGACAACRCCPTSRCERGRERDQFSPTEAPSSPVGRGLLHQRPQHRSRDVRPRPGRSSRRCPGPCSCLQVGGGLGEERPFSLSDPHLQTPTEDCGHPD